MQPNPANFSQINQAAAAAAAMFRKDKDHKTVKDPEEKKKHDALVEQMEQAVDNQKTQKSDGHDFLA